MYKFTYNGAFTCWWHCMVSLAICTRNIWQSIWNRLCAILLKRYVYLLEWWHLPPRFLSILRHTLPPAAGRSVWSWWFLVDSLYGNCPQLKTISCSRSYLPTGGQPASNDWLILGCKHLVPQVGAILKHCPISRAPLWLTKTIGVTTSLVSSSLCPILLLTPFTDVDPEGSPL